MERSDDDFLTVNETAQRLRVSATTVRNWAAEGRLAEHRTPGGHRRFRAPEVDELARQLAPQRTPKILIIDDDPAIRFVVREGLQAAGFDVAEAGSGLLGLDALDEEPPSVVLLDIMMPGIDGFQVMRYLEQYNVTVPVIAFSALGPRVSDKAHELGAVDFISKPFELRDLILRIRSALEAAQQVR
jgi:excisionase family DNA binding protein